MSQEAHSRNAAQKVRPGMSIRDTKGHLGQKALSLPKVKALRRNRQGAVKSIIVEKGALFKKDLEIPAAGADRWLMRLVPAAAFSIQQTIPNYPQVSSVCSVAQGCYPLAPWAGFAVLCAWAAAALGLAVFLVRRRDA